MAGGTDLINVIVSLALGAAPAAGMAAPAAPVPDPVVICEPGGSSQWETDAQNLADELAGVTGDQDVDALREELAAAGFEPDESARTGTDTPEREPRTSQSDPAESDSGTGTGDARDGTAPDGGQDWRELAATLEDELTASDSPEADQLAGELESLDLAAAAGLPARTPGNPPDDTMSDDTDGSGDGPSSDERSGDSPAGIDESTDPEPADSGTTDPGPTDSGDQDRPADGSAAEDSTTGDSTDGSNGRDDPADPAEDCRPAEGSDRSDDPVTGDDTSPTDTTPADTTPAERRAPAERRGPADDSGAGARTPADEVGLPRSPSTPRTTVCMAEDAPVPRDTAVDSAPATTQGWEQMAGQLAVALDGNTDPRARQLSQDLAAAGFGPREEEWVQIARELAAAVESSSDPRAQQLAADLTDAGFSALDVPVCDTDFGDVGPGDRVVADDTPSDTAGPGTTTVGTRTR